jgi:hypothetical protein
MRRAGLVLALGSLTLLALPLSAGAVTTTLTNGDGIDFANTDPAFHPGDPYPSTITGPAGTVNDVNVSLTYSLANPEEFDIALVSPNGTAVHIQSDACPADENVFHSLSFDDDGGGGFLSSVGACPSASNPYQVTNHPEVPDIYSAPGPQAGTLNALSFFDGGPSGGAWRLFTMDDTGNPPNTGGSISGWSITLDFTPAPPATAPSNVFTGVLTPDAAGRGALVLTLPGPGSVTVSDAAFPAPFKGASAAKKKKVRRPAFDAATVTAVAAGQLSIPIQPKGKINGKIKSGKGATINVRAKYTPTGGTASEQTFSARFKKAKKKK